METRAEEEPEEEDAGSTPLLYDEAAFAQALAGVREFVFALSQASDTTAVSGWLMETHGEGMAWAAYAEGVFAPFSVAALTRAAKLDVSSVAALEEEEEEKKKKEEETETSIIRRWVADNAAAMDDAVAAKAGTDLTADDLVHARRTLALALLANPETRRDVIAAATSALLAEPAMWQPSGSEEALEIHARRTAGQLGAAAFGVVVGLFALARAPRGEGSGGGGSGGGQENTLQPGQVDLMTATLAHGVRASRLAMGNHGSASGIDPRLLPVLRAGCHKIHGTLEALIDVLMVGCGADGDTNDQRDVEAPLWLDLVDLVLAVCGLDSGASEASAVADLEIKHRVDRATLRKLLFCRPPVDLATLADRSMAFFRAYVGHLAGRIDRAVARRRLTLPLQARRGGTGMGGSVGVDVGDGDGEDATDTADLERRVLAMSCGTLQLGAAMTAVLVTMAGRSASHRSLITDMGVNLQ